MDIVPLAALAALVYTLINFFKYLTNADWKSAITIAVVWIAGILAVTIAAHTDFAASITIIDDIALDKLNFWSLLFTGLIIGSLGSSFFDLKKALDGNDSAKTPPLVP